MTICVNPHSKTKKQRREKEEDEKFLGGEMIAPVTECLAWRENHAEHPRTVERRRGDQPVRSVCFIQERNGAQAVIVNPRAARGDGESKNNCPMKNLWVGCVS